MKQIFLSAFMSTFLLGACSDAPKKTGEQVVKNARDEARMLTWEELMPEGEEERLYALYEAQAESGIQIAEGGAEDVAVQIGSFNIVSTLDGQRVRLPGYTVPFEYGVDAQITEFLLVPYFGACLHAPPPPPNQTIFITTAAPIKLADLDQAVWVEGTLRTNKQETALADAAYTIELDVIEAY